MTKEQRQERNRTIAIIDNEVKALATARRDILRLAIKANRTPKEEKRLALARSEHENIPRLISWLERSLGDRLFELQEAS